MRCLNGSGLNPKSKLTTKHVTKANIKEFFGKIAKFKTTNTHLHVDTKKKLLDLWHVHYYEQQIYVMGNKRVHSGS